MVEPLKTSKENAEKEVFHKKRKVLAPWRFQEGYERWPNQNKAENFEDGRKSHATEQDLSNDQLKNGRGSNNVTSVGRLNMKISNGEVRGPNCVNQGLHGKVECEENSRSTKDLGYLNGNSKKPRVMSKLYKALATWRFQPGYKRQFSGENLRRRVPISPYSPRKYHSGVQIPISCDDPGLNSPNKKESFSKGCTRDNVSSSLHEFRSIYRELLAEDETKRLLDSDIASTRCDWLAFRKFKERNSYDDVRKFVGQVPGTCVGDIFHLRVELCVVGLHHQHHLSVDFIKGEQGNLAISVVSYGNLAELKKKKKIDVVEFSSSSVVASNATLDGSNLALIRSLETRTPVRFIYGLTLHLSATEILKTKAKKLNTYIYCGLYTVEKYSRKRSGDGNHYFYMFRLRRVAGQPDMDIRAVLESRKLDSFLFPVMCMEDLSFGKEKVPISVVNFIDSEKPPFFKYITGLRTRVLRDPTPDGCGCTNGCSDSVKCACVVKNGGELPFNDEGHLVEVKPLVFECGPACKCPPTCPNRVSQHGIKHRLQVFKTKDMGWGVRALEFIPSGSFVCEYVAELIPEEEAQRRPNDEYLFTIGNNYYDEKLWEGLKRSIPALKRDTISKDREGDEVFTLDASEFGNFTRFINHSCMPNLFAQNVLYDHDNIKMPRIMFFATENIQPMEELAYHYNYTVDQVHDADGNVKKKKCFCGTEECTGWLY
jgi:SAD/SRA domain/SET domain/Pre-SET motif